eukprot:m.297334 g.297334  ORF g.297334 m.297334 type:complete len:136 (-) comp20078_c1_seq4:197-604(-)
MITNHFVPIRFYVQGPSKLTDNDKRNAPADASPRPLLALPWSLATSRGGGDVKTYGSVKHSRASTISWFFRRAEWGVSVHTTRRPSAKQFIQQKKIMRRTTLVSTERSTEAALSNPVCILAEDDGNNAAEQTLRR